MDRDTIDDMDTIDLGLGLELSDSRLPTVQEDALDPEELEPTTQTPVHGTIAWSRPSDPDIEPPRR